MIVVQDECASRRSGRKSLCGGGNGQAGAGAWRRSEIGARRRTSSTWRVAPLANGAQERAQAVNQVGARTGDRAKRGGSPAVRRRTMRRVYRARGQGLVEYGLIIA